MRWPCPTTLSLIHISGAEGGAPILAGGQYGSGSPLLPLLGIGRCTRQRLPRLDADKAHRGCAGAPKQSIGVACHIADDAAAGILLINAHSLGAQARHAVAVGGKQLVRQRDGLGVLPLVTAFAAQQAIGAAIQDQDVYKRQAEDRGLFTKISKKHHILPLK